MMPAIRTQLSILNSTGDITITWDHDDPAARDRARAEVERLRSVGYAFFLVSGEPADEVAAGGGTLVVRRLTADELIGAPDAEEINPQAEGSAASAGPTPDAGTMPDAGMTHGPGIGAGPGAGPESPDDPPKRRRGRPARADRRAIAVRPLQGG